jgi:carbonic anhydrase
MHLNISVNEMVSLNLPILQMRAESKLKNLAIELDKLRRDNDLDPLSLELPALQATFKEIFDAFKLAKLIPEDATYVRYFPAPAGKK